MNFSQYFSKTAWLLILPLFFIVSCKKDTIEEPIIITSSLETDEATLLAAISDDDVANFFNLDFIEAANPNVVPLLGTPATTLPAAAADVYLDVLIKNEEENNIKGFIPIAGYPLWHRMSVFDTEDSNDKLVVIPFVTLDGENTSTVMIGIPDSDDPFYAEHDSDREGYFYIMTTREQMAEILEDLDNPVENLYLTLKFFIDFDASIFDFRNETWIQIWEDYDDGFQGEDTVDDRDACTINICIAPYVAVQGEVDDRGCTWITLSYTCGTLPFDVYGGGTISEEYAAGIGSLWGW